VDASLPALAQYAGGDERLTFFELRRICSTAPGDFTVTYRRNAATGTLTVAGGPSRAIRRRAVRIRGS